jgi:hypothetical protein
MKFNAQDEAMLRALDDFEISADNETATIAGGMEVVVVRFAEDRFRLTIKFPSGETLDVRIARAQLLEELGVKADDS